MSRQPDPVDITIHVGLPKTGTTWLQEKVFAEHPQLQYHHYMSWETDVDEQPVVWSNEDLCGYGLNQMRHNHSRVITENIHRWFPNAKIIVCFREINQWIDSMYKETIRQGSTLSIEEYMQMALDFMMPFDLYTYLLKSLFDKVLILNYNELQKHPQQTVGRICRFIGVDKPINIDVQRTNISLTDRQTNMLRCINRWWHGPYNPQGLFPFRLHYKMLGMVRK